MEQIQRELKRGTLEMLLLRVLADEATWGYELVRRLDERSKSRFQIKEGTLYPILYRLEDANLIAPEWSRPERGVPRKYYRLTTSGHERLDELTRAWKSFARAVDAVLEEPERKETS
jgi:PadR family transcriptional regulator PadR